MTVGNCTTHSNSEKETELVTEVKKRTKGVGKGTDVNLSRCVTTNKKKKVEKKSDTASWTGSNVAANQKKW